MRLLVKLGYKLHLSPGKKGCWKKQNAKEHAHILVPLQRDRLA
jgi:hypothetical protein